MTVSELPEKVAYLKGLAEGLGIGEDSKEGKLMLAMIDVLASIASDLDVVEANSADMADQMDDLCEDMAYLEDLVMDELYGEDEDDCECDGDCDSCDEDCCGCCDEPEYEVTCPQCGEVVTVYEEDLAFGSILCPICGADLEFDFDEDDSENEE